jgi:hypothetical protein
MLTCVVFAISRRYAVITIDANRPRGGGSNSPNPGVLRWRTPSGRTYTTIPSVYPA